MSAVSPTNTIDTGSGGTYAKDGFEQILAEVVAIYTHLNSAFKLQTGDAFPGSPVTGELCVKTTGGATPTLYRYSGSEWVQLGESGGFATGVAIDTAFKGYTSGMQLARASASSVTIAATSTIMINGALLQNTSLTTLGTVTEGDWDIYAERSGTTTNYVLAKAAHPATLSAGQRLVGRVGRNASDVVLVTSVEPAPSVTALPPGMMAPFAGSAAPSGWLLCDGTEYSTTAFAALYAAIGDTYGTGVGTFMVPDMRTRVPAGYAAADTEGFETLGAELGTFPPAVPAHVHTIPHQTSPAGYAYYLGLPGAKGPVDSAAVDTSSTGAADETTLQPTLVVNYIIKY